MEDFKHIKDLARLVQFLDDNDFAYDEYLTYKEEGGITNKFLIDYLNKREWSKYDDIKRPYNSFFTGFECYICEQIHNNIKVQRSGQMVVSKVANNSHYGCPAPKRFSDEGQYNVEDPRYSYHYYEGKYRAKAFRYFYDRHIHFTEKTISDLAQSYRKEFEDKG